MPELIPSGAITNAPWHADDDLQWRPSGGRFVLCALPHSVDDCLREADTAHCGKVIEIAAPEPGFENLAGLDALLDVLRRMLGSRFDLLRERHADVLNLLTGPGHREQLGRLVPISEAAALGTTRRVSRESHTSALWIDQAARLLVDGVMLVAAPGTSATLQVSAIDMWDRPSVRIIYRAVAIAPPDRPLSVVGRMRHWHPSDTDGSTAADALNWLRSHFLAAVAARPASVVHETRGTGTPAPDFDLSDIAKQVLDQDRDALLRLVGNSLSLQNFERAELLIQASLTVCARQPADPDTMAHLLRLSAISAAQVGHIDEALHRLNQAVGTARSHEIIAHLYYLLGLISTKRHYNIATARKYYETAREAVTGSSGQSTAALVEKAWISNGIALIAAMEARGCDDQPARSELYKEAFREEFSAFHAVRDLPGPSAFYLRFNLGYNLAFLLQITGRYMAAKRFLQSMAAVLYAGHPDYGALFNYTVGILELKNADYDDAAASLSTAIELSLSVRDFFYAEKMLVALAYTKHSRAAHAEAAAHYREGALLAKWLGDEVAYRKHLSGLLWSIALGDLSFTDDVRQAAAIWFPSVTETFTASPDSQERADALKLCNAVIEVPSSKLPSYIPTVDLEGAPQRDINRMLVGVSATELPGRIVNPLVSETLDEPRHHLVRQP